jgi:predicted ribosomally synthesized peptide with SipW-like signal peptide
MTWSSARLARKGQPNHYERGREKVKRKVLASLLVIAVIASLVGASTWAYFHDTAAIDNNYVSTGNLDLTVWGGPFVVENLEPGAGYRDAGVFCAKNDGNYDMKWQGWLTSVSDPKGLRDYLYVKVVMNPTGNQGNYGPSNTTLWTDVPFTTLESASSYILMNDAVWPFGPGDWACYGMGVKLISSAPDSVQGARVDSNLYLEATQRINPGW